MSHRLFHVVFDCRTNTFVLEGELDLSSVDGLREALAAVRTPTITLDLRLLTFISSAGLACLADTAQRHPHVVLRGVRPGHRRLLEITKLSAAFDIQDPPLAIRGPTGSRSVSPERG